jgi:hypothetical protein
VWFGRGVGRVEGGSLSEGRRGPQGWWRTSRGRWRRSEVQVMLKSHPLPCEERVALEHAFSCRINSFGLERRRSTSRATPGVDDDETAMADKWVRLRVQIVRLECTPRKALASRQNGAVPLVRDGTVSKASTYRWVESIDRIARSTCTASHITTYTYTYTSIQHLNTIAQNTTQPPTV